ncbi:MAG TPA: MATE family efflux transporter [Caldisericia bacterium]|nr:MATE family efflux transporter [Caldisericia bacterium]HRT37620.1 MATE family efflux transporter [Caldisericia bacterium]HRU74153.1 MATE family efflux transporter [Caldisericia bacterium]
MIKRNFNKKIIDKSNIEDGTVKKFLSLALPSVGENLFHTLFSFVDMAFVGRLGALPLAGVGLANQLIFVFIAIMVAINIGTNVLVAQNYGAKKYIKTKEIIWQSLYLVVFISIGFLIFGLFFSYSVFYPFSGEIALKKISGDYLYWIITPSFIFVAPFVLGAIFRGIGDTKTLFYVTSIANGLNIFLDYVLIFGKLGFPNLGVKGAAIATSLSRLVALIIYFYLLFNKKRKFHLSNYFPKIDFIIIKNLIKIGFPASLERFLFSFGNLFFGNVVLSIGTEAFAAHRVSINIESLSSNTGFGFTNATQTLVGQSVGKNDEKLAKKYTYTALKMTVLIMSIVGVFLFFFPDFFIRIFTDDITVIEHARIAVRIISVVQPFYAMVLIFMGSLRGGGNTASPLLATALGMYLIRIPVSYVLVKILGLGMLGAWTSMAIDITFKGFFLYFIFLKRTNYKRYVLE